MSMTIFLENMEEHVDVNYSHDRIAPVSIRALRRNTRNLISALLNPMKIIPNDKGLPRDWQGLAELCGISGERIPSLQHDTDPSNRVLQLWSENNENDSTIDKFIMYLEELDRFDIIEDITSLIDEDINYFKQHPNGFKCTYPEIDVDNYILTVDDVPRLRRGLEPQTYDAFVLFANEDIDFATELIETMEKQYNLKFCVKDRDLVGGGFEHESVIKLISERCWRLIVILSPAFLNSAANKFFYSFAQAIGIEQRQRKIVPCIYKSCGRLPSELSCYVILDYERTNKLWNNFWEKLYSSVKVPEQSCNILKNRNLVRSVSDVKSVSQRSLLNGAVLQESATPDNLNSPSHVKFKSMVDLNSVDNQEIIPDENMTESNSATSLGSYPGKSKNKTSLYKHIRKLVKSKGIKTDEVKPEKPKAAVNSDKIKLKNFFSRNSKKKVALEA